MNISLANLDRNKLTVTQLEAVSTIAELTDAVIESGPDPFVWADLAEAYDVLGADLEEGSKLLASLQASASKARAKAEDVAAGQGKDVAMLWGLAKDLARMQESGASEENTSELRKEIGSLAGFQASHSKSQYGRKRYGEMALEQNPDSSGGLLAMAKYYQHSDPDTALSFIDRLYSSKDEMINLYRASGALTACEIYRARNQEGNVLHTMVVQMAHDSDFANLWPDLKGFTWCSASCHEDILKKLDKAIAAEPEKTMHVFIKGLYMKAKENEARYGMAHPEYPGNEKYWEETREYVKGGDDVLNQAFEMAQHAENYYELAACLMADHREYDEAAALLKRGLHVSRQNPDLLQTLSLVWEVAASVAGDEGDIVAQQKYEANKAAVTKLQDRVARRAEVQPA